jgi:hypothetical protein
VFAAALLEAEAVAVHLQDVNVMGTHCESQPFRKHLFLEGLKRPFLAPWNQALAARILDRFLEGSGGKKKAGRTPPKSVAGNDTFGSALHVAVKKAAEVQE